MSKSQRDKGNRFEREVVNYLKEKGFHDAKRIPLSGSQQGFKGDLIIQRTEDSPSLLGECKCRASGFKLIYDYI
jgi:Holliday junction resolvase